MEAKEYSKVTEDNKLYVRFIGRDTPRRVAVSAGSRSSRELGRMQGLYRVLGGQERGR